MTRYLVDTNVLVRFLTADDEVQHGQAVALFQQAWDGRCRLVLPDAVLVETVWVLTSAKGYGLGRGRVAGSLGTLIGQPGIVCKQVEVMQDALRRFKESKCSIVDCLLAAQGAASGDVVATFDRGLAAILDGPGWLPGEN